MSDQGPEAPKDYTESVKSATEGALDQVQGTYNRASWAGAERDRSGSRSHPKSALDRYRRGLGDRDHRGATLGPNLTVAVAPESVRTQRRKARAGEPTRSRRAAPTRATVEASRRASC
jgi:hypothetical protein